MEILRNQQTGLQSKDAYWVEFKPGDNLLLHEARVAIHAIRWQLGDGARLKAVKDNTSDRLQRLSMSTLFTEADVQSIFASLTWQYVDYMDTQNDRNVIELKASRRQLDYLGIALGNYCYAAATRGHVFQDAAFIDFQKEATIASMMNTEIELARQAHTIRQTI